jgi:excisionase family DNA binding protein
MVHCWLGLAIYPSMSTTAPDVTGRKPTPELKPLFCTVPDAARMLGVSIPSIYALITDGKLRSVKLGRSRRILIESVQALAEEAA